MMALPSNQFMSNNSIKVLAIEDSPFQAEMLANKLVSGGYELVGPFNNGEKAFAHLANLEVKPDVAILDIEIEGKMDGIETAKELHSKYGISIIFLSHKQDDDTRKRLGDVPAIFYSKSDNLINNIALFDAIDRSANKQPGKPSELNKEPVHNLVAINTRNGTQIVNIEDIQWIEAEADVAFLHLKNDNRKHIAKGTLKEIENKLARSNPEFIRISKQYIVNMKEVSGINKHHIDENGRKKEVIELKGSETKLNIGRTYKKNLKKVLREL